MLPDFLVQDTRPMCQVQPNQVIREKKREKKENRENKKKRNSQLSILREHESERVK